MAICPSDIIDESQRIGFGLSYNFEIWTRGILVFRWCLKK